MNKQEILEIIITNCKKHGASHAEAVYIDSQSLAISQRMRKPEDIERSETMAVGVRAIFGQRQAFASSNDLSPASLAEMAARAAEMAKLAPADEMLRLNEDKPLPCPVFADNYDESDISPEKLREMAVIAEEKALSHAGIINSEGASASFAKSNFALMTANGFYGYYSTSSYSLSACVIGEKDGAMERDYEYDSKRYFADLLSPEYIGNEAARLTLRRLGARKIKSGLYPVIFEPRVAKSLISSFASAINGDAVAKKSTFLAGKKGEMIFNDKINIIDNPMIAKGLGSRPFDGEGFISQKKSLVSGGILENYFLDLRSAAKLDIQANQSAARGLASPPMPSSSNLYLANGAKSQQEMIRDIGNGLLISEVFGMGVNIITGDYSQGASGFMIENGEITYPVSEITIAGNLVDMFKNMIPANDLQFKYSTNSPSILIPQMTIAGS